MSWTARPDQVEDLTHLILNPKTMVLHDPGVGKTITAALHTEYNIRHKNQKVAWTQPVSLIQKNVDELLKFTCFDEKDIVSVTGSPKKRLEKMEGPGKVFLFGGDGFAKEGEILLKHHPDVRVNILDEPHLYFAGHNSKRTQAWYRLARHMNSIVPMTGTIIKGKLDSIYPFLHAMFPQYYGMHENFIAKHAVQDENGKLIHWQHHEHLRKILERHSICRSFESVYGPDGTVVITEPCELSAVQREKYDELEAFALIELEDVFIEAGSPGVKAIRARQVMSCPEHLGIVRHDFRTPKDDLLMVHIQEAIAMNERLTIFAAFVPEQERIMRMLDALGVKAALINGNTPMNKRRDIDREFQAGLLQFVVGSPACMAVGFNWGFLYKIVFTSLDYMDDSFVQAYKRGVRGKREKPLLVYVLEYKDSLDQRVFRIVEGKSKDANLITPHKPVLNFSAGRALSDLTDAETGEFSMSRFMR